MYSIFSANAHRDVTFFEVDENCSKYEKLIPQELNWLFHEMKKEYETVPQTTLYVIGP